MDKLTPERRSLLMAKIKAKDTKPEMAVRSMLHSMGYRFRIHRKNLPWTPDIALPRRSTVVFVHGCFWHGHVCKKTKMPKTRTEYWFDTITGNRRRDALKQSKLQALGWKVVVVWECELKSPARLASKLRRCLDRL